MKTPLRRITFSVLVPSLMSLSGVAPVGAAALDQRLVNISSRAPVGTGSAVLVAGFVIGTGAPKKVLIRAIGPALSQFGVSGPLVDPQLTVFNSSGVSIGSNDNWSSSDASTFSDVGAFALPAGSKDSSLVLTLSPGVYTAQVSGVNSATGVGLVEVYDVSGSAQLMNISTRAQVGTGSGVLTAGFVVASSGGGARRLLMRAIGPSLSAFGVAGVLDDPTLTLLNSSGTAIGFNDNWSDSDYSAVAAASSVVGAFPLSLGSKDAALLMDLQPGTYTLQVAGVNNTTGVGLVEVYDVTASGGSSVAPPPSGNSAGTLYAANLRPPASAATSTAYGTATFQFSADGSSIFVNASFSNLSSNETVAYLRYGNLGEDGAYLFKLPDGQVSSAQWVIQPTGNLSVADIAAALKSGHVYLSIGTVNFPSGELLGSFVQSTGSQAFVAPPAPPALPAGLPTPQDAARFLTQATFGPTKADIDALTAKGFSAWLTEQMAMTPSSHRAATLDDFTNFPPGGSTPTGTNRQAAWWKIAVTAPDQLRQRVAFALSEIFVISDVNTTIGNAQEGAANYYDMLATGAFGNFRQLLENVTLSPMMGIYLSSLRNAKADSSGAQPDENYAREVMQLFTIGLNQLQPDGTLKLDAAGLPIPTYNQTTITETAKVFTGWAYHSTATNPSFRGATADYINPMMLYPNFHDTSAKTIVTGKVLPAGQSGTQDLKDELDTLFNHPNTAPFICRELIQRLVTSNPSPGYVYRVAQVFANNGAGVRGDLGAVVKAILTDYEARSTAVIGNTGYGKLKEPLLRVTALLRAFNGSAGNGRFSYSNPETNLDQAALRAPSVFNFFEPNFVLPGELAAAGLFAPEYQILTDSTAITVPNQLYTFITANAGTTTISLNYSAVLSMAKTPVPLVDYLNLVLAGGGLAQSTKDRIVAALNAVPASTSDTDRVRTAIYLIVTTAEGSVQK